MSYQKAIIIGNLGAEPTTNHFDGGGQMTQLSVATTEHWNDKTTGEKKERVEWHRCVLNGKLSELADKYLEKGSKVLIEGTLRTSEYTDGQGVTRYTTEIYGQTMKFLSSQKPQTTPTSAVDDYMEKNKETINDGIPSTSKEFDDLPLG